jgi:hypothetical protein
VLKLSLPVCITCGLVFSAGATGAVKQVETAWTDLGGLISSRKVALVLPDGAAIESKAISVQPDALIVSAIFGLPVAGFFAGRALDRRVTLIKITP